MWIVGVAVIPSAFALAWLGHLIEGNNCPLPHQKLRF